MADNLELFPQKPIRSDNIELNLPDTYTPEDLNSLLSGIVEKYADDLPFILPEKIRGADDLPFILPEKIRDADDLPFILPEKIRDADDLISLISKLKQNPDDLVEVLKYIKSKKIDEDFNILANNFLNSTYTFEDTFANLDAWQVLSGSPTINTVVADDCVELNPDDSIRKRFRTVDNLIPIREVSFDLYLTADGEISGNRDFILTDGNGSYNILQIEGTGEYPAYSYDLYMNNRVGNIRYIRDTINGNDSDSTNRWIEVQAIDLDGVNRAYNKTVTGSVPSALNRPYTRVVDNNVSSELYAQTSENGEQYITIDLGDIYDIEYINIRRYYGYTFNDIHTEVSADGITWYTIYDSDVNGIYEETESGLNLFTKKEFIQSLTKDTFYNLRLALLPEVNEIQLFINNIWVGAYPYFNVEMESIKFPTGTSIIYLDNFFISGELKDRPILPEKIYGTDDIVLLINAIQSISIFYEMDLQFVEEYAMDIVVSNYIPDYIMNLEVM